MARTSRAAPGLARLSALALALLACSAPAPLEPSALEGVQHPPELQELVEALEAKRVELHVPGMALGIVRDGTLVLSRGFGLADVEAGRTVTPETIFAIGSTTKAFTAALVGLLQEEGRLAFDDPVTRALPEFVLPIDGEGPVRMSDLLSHRTGFARMDILWYGGRASAQEVLRTALGAEPLAPFGQRFLYNNVMFLAAGEACAAVTGRPWAELVRERLLVPLGMRATTTDVRAAKDDPRLARGYQWNETERRFEHKPMRVLDAIAPAGALNSNVVDLARWVRCLLADGELEGRRVLAAETLAELWRPRNSLGEGVHYGLGWFLREWKGEPYVEHGGNIDGFAAQIALLPERRLGVVLLTNVSATPLQGMVGPLVFEALLGASAATPPAHDESERFLGTYRANFFQFHDAAFEVLTQNGRLAVDIPGQATFELAPPDASGKRPFALLPEQIQVSFTEHEGRVTALVLYQNGLAFECFREGYEPPAEQPLEEFEPYLGEYADPLSGKTFTLLVQHNRLAVDYPEQMVYELFPPDEDGRWVFRATPLLALEFQDSDEVVFHERGTKRVCTRVNSGTALPTLEELLAARGVEDFERRLAELGTLRLEGSVRFVSCGIRGTTTTVFDASERLRETSDLAPFVTSTLLYDGTRGRARSDLEGEHELAGPHLDQARSGSPAVFFGDWRKRYDAARVLRVRTVEGREQVEVELEKGLAPPQRVTLDRQSGDLIQVEVRELVEGVGELPKTVRFEDWRVVEGLRLPMRVISQDEVSGRVVVEYTRLVPHGTVDWAEFEDP